MIKIPLLDDVLKGLPDNARLRGDVIAYAKRIEELESEIASLKDDKRELQAANKRLNERLTEQTDRQGDNTEDLNLDDMEIEFLKMMSAFESLTAESIAQGRQLHLQRVRFHLERLISLDLIDSFSPFGDPAIHNLTQKGRAYLIQKNLL